MHEDIPYSYITLLAFDTLIKTGNKRYLKIDELREFMDLVLTDAVIYDHVKFNPIDEISELDNFIDEYSDYFYLNPDGIICIYDGVNSNDIEELLDEYEANEEIDSDIYCLPDDYISTLKSIGSTKLIDLYDNLLVNEIKIETAYEIYMREKNENNKKALDKLVILKKLILFNIKILGKDKIEAIKDIGNDKEYNECDFIYDKFPFDENLWYKKGYTTTLFSDLDSNCYELYQLAIFGEYPLYYSKLSKDVEELYYEVENDEEDYEDEELESLNDEKVFFERYLHNLMKYLEIDDDEDLNSVKYRLLYSFDNADKTYYISGYNYENNVELPIELPFYESEALFMIDEVFINDDCYTKEKLLFIKTYYELTNDERIIRKLNSYSSSPKYEIFCNIIFDLNRGKSRELK